MDGNLLYINSIPLISDKKAGNEFEINVYSIEDCKLINCFKGNYDIKSNYESVSIINFDCINNNEFIACGSENSSKNIN
jgi:hypothetical protein